jgi:Na+/H+ antiporter NhaD/arsenite permease-like protein
LLLHVQAGFSLWRTFTALPWHVVPFLFGMFIMVEALNQGGWVDYFGRVRLHLLAGLVPWQPLRYRTPPAVTQ